MVEDTRKKVRAEAFRPLNAPEPVTIQESPRGLPQLLKNGQGQKVASVIDQWRIDDEWWRPEPLSRVYYSIILETGQPIEVFKDLINNRWFSQNY